MSMVPDFHVEENRKHVLFVLGTRPEAIKLAPVITAFESHPHLFKTSVVITSQHREMLDQVLSVFRINPAHDLNVMSPNQTLAEVTLKVLKGLEEILRVAPPSLVFVQGDTTTAFVGALAAFYRGIPVAHVEAGLRTFDRRQPFPEEANRTMISALADLHFAPTESAAANLLHSGIDGKSVHITGNTVIDALLNVTSVAHPLDAALANVLDEPNRRILLVTAHRRENQGGPIREICAAILKIVERVSDLTIIFPVHLSPKVREVVFPMLSGHPRIHLIAPQDYPAFCQLLKRSDVVLTDSGGIQEEAPSLAKPVLVMRDTTERPEAVAAGVARLVGTSMDRLVQETCLLFEDSKAYSAMAQAVNPYGDGLAADRIFHLSSGFLGVSLPNLAPQPFASSSQKPKHAHNIK